MGNGQKMGGTSETACESSDGTTNRLAKETSQLLRFQATAVSNAIPREHRI